MATAQQSNKQSRIDETSSRKQSGSPLATAKNVVTTYCESLQPSLQDLLTDSVLKNFLVHMEIANRKARAVSKLETDNEYVPRSIKLNCNLYCTKLAEKDTEYNNLSEHLKQSVITFQNSAKAVVQNAASLDVRVHKHAAKKSLCEGLYQIASAYVTLNKHNTNQVHKFANTIMEPHHEDIMPMFELPNDFATLDHFKTNYITYTSATGNLPNPFVAPDAHLAHNNAGGNNANGAAAAANPYANTNQQAQITAETRKNEDTIAQIWRCIRTCYLDSWVAFLRQQQQNDAALKLKKLSTDLLTRNATAAAQMQVDQEPAIDPQQLKTLIEQGVATATASMRQTIQSLESRLKTLKRGAHGAPQRKKQKPERAENSKRPTTKQTLLSTLPPQELPTTTPTDRTGDQEGEAPTQTDVEPGSLNDPTTDAASLWLLCGPNAFTSFECDFLSWKYAGMVLLLPPSIIVIS